MFCLSVSVYLPSALHKCDDACKLLLGKFFEDWVNIVDASTWTDKSQKGGAPHR